MVQILLPTSSQEAGEPDACSLFCWEAVATCYPCPFSTPAESRGGRHDAMKVPTELKTIVQTCRETILQCMRILYSSVALFLVDRASLCYSSIVPWLMRGLRVGQDWTKEIAEEMMHEHRLKTQHDFPTISN